MASRDYLLAGSDIELKRLAYQSMLFENETLTTLEHAGIKQGMKCLDLGCGLGDVSFMMSKLVGPKGSVVGLDTNENLIKLCVERAKKNHTRNATFAVGDVYDTKLKKNSFDLIFSRFLFQHLKEPERAIKEMVSLAHRDGIIATEELDHGSWISYPPIASLEKLRQVYVNLLKSGGVDELVGRKLYNFFCMAGLRSKASAYSICLPLDREPFNMIGILMAEVLRPRIMKAGLMTDNEFDEMVKDLRKHMKDPTGIMLYALTFRVWGTKS